VDPIRTLGYEAWLITFVNLVDKAMAAEGIKGDVRDKVVSRLYGDAPTPDEPLPASAGPPMNASGL